MLGSVRLGLYDTPDSTFSSITGYTTRSPAQSAPAPESCPRMALGFLSRWRPRHLFGALVVYWGALAAGTLGGAIAAAWRVTHLGKGEGGISLSYGDGLLELVMKANEQPVWTGSGSFTAVAFWIAGPPLLLWFGWLFARGRAERSARFEREVAADRGRGRIEAGFLNAPGPSEEELLRRDAERRRAGVEVEGRE